MISHDNGRLFETNGFRTLWRSAKRAFPPDVKRGLRRAQRAVSYVPRQLFGTITHVLTDHPAVAITFDDGPNPLATPQILELLESYGARGTFFLLGQCAQAYPDLLARIRRGGHAVGNHSWDHPSFPAISAQERRRQITECGRVLGPPPCRLFRPPYGDQTWLTRLDAFRLGWDVVAWSVSGTDWRGDGPETIADRILHDLRPGSIVLLHDALYRYEDTSFVSRAATLAALATVLRVASTRFRFVTVPELLALGRPNRELWIQPGQADYLARLKSGAT